MAITINQKLNTQDGRAKYDIDVDTRAELEEAKDRYEIHTRAFIIEELMYVILDKNKNIVNLYKLAGE